MDFIVKTTATWNPIYIDSVARLQLPEVLLRLLVHRMHVDSDGFDTLFTLGDTARSGSASCKDDA